MMGEGCPKNGDKGIQYFRLAAAQGDADAQNELKAILNPQAVGVGLENDGCWAQVMSKMRSICSRG